MRGFRAVELTRHLGRGRLRPRVRQGLPEGLAGQAGPPVWEAPRGRPTFFLLSGWAVPSRALREVRVPCAESGCILWIWGAAHRVGVLSTVEVDLQSQGAFCGFGVQCTELGCSMRLGRLAESGCILWVWGAACSVGVHSADSRRNVQSWDALAELRCSVQSRVLGTVGLAFGKPPWLWAKSCRDKQDAGPGPPWGQWPGEEARPDPFAGAGPVWGPSRHRFQQNKGSRGQASAN